MTGTGQYFRATAENFLVVGHFGNSKKSACAKNAQAEIVLIRPNSADLDYAFQQSGNKLREVVFNSGEFARIRLICAFFLFMCNVQFLHIPI